MLQNTLYTIEKISQEGENKYTVAVTIDPEHEIFKGHFPNQPILPGVCMMEMSREILMHIRQSPISLDNARNIKFLKIVNPREDPSLRFEFENLEKDGFLQTNVTSYLTDGTPNFKLKATYSLSKD